MVCYICGGSTQVINSRPQKRTNQVWRRRACILCDSVFSTEESIDYTKSLRVQSIGNRQLEPFSRDRLLLSLHKSLGHRPIALHDASGLCATIMTKVTQRAQNGVVSRENIIQVAMVALNRFDTLAAQHYQAFHKL